MKKIQIFIIAILFTSFSFAQFGNSLYTDGIQDYVLLPDNNAFDLTDNFTIECWIQAKLVDTLHIFRKGWCSGSDDSYYLSIMNGKVRWHWNYDGNCNHPNSYETNNVVVHDGDCVHITVVHSSSEVKIYINEALVPGTLISGNYSTVHNSTNGMSIGAYRFLAGNYGVFYWGSVDELRFWNYKLSAQEIIDYANAPLNGDEPGLVAYFDMEDSGVGTSLTITNKATASGSIIGTAYGTANSPLFITSCISTSNNDISQNSEDQIYPNPAKNIVNIEGKNNFDLQVFDIIGNLIISKKNLSGNSEINISRIKRGAYIFKITRKSYTINKIIVKI